MVNDFCEAVLENSEDTADYDPFDDFDITDNSFSFPLKYCCLLCKTIYFAEDELDSHNITVHCFPGTLCNEPLAIEALVRGYFFHYSIINEEK